MKTIGNQVVIRSVINLDDSIEVMQSYETFPGSYYSRCAVVNPEMTYDFGSAEFDEKVRESILFILCIRSGCRSFIPDGEDSLVFPPTMKYDHFPFSKR